MPFAAVCGAAPHLDAAPFHQSPVEAAPDALLQLHGSSLHADDTVVYEMTDDVTTLERRARSVPARSTRERGVARVVAAMDAPRTLVVQLPAVLEPRAIYALRVRSRRGEWSNAVPVNDPRPLWFSPASFELQSDGAAPRRLRIVGRNLAAPAGMAYTLRLRGPASVEASLSPDPAAGAEFALLAQLPASLPPGRYQVEMGSGQRWQPVGTSKLEIIGAAGARRTLSIDDAALGGCRANDHRDDSRCFREAFRRADAATLDVEVGPGVWDLMAGAAGGRDALAGMVLPVGLRLRGAGSQRTTIRRHPGWLDTPGSATFTLSGHNVVSDLHFDDVRMPAASSGVSPTLRLGPLFYVQPAGPGRVVTDLRILRNRFTGASTAIADGGLPLRRLVIAENLFRADQHGLWLGGHTRNALDEFMVEDALIDANRFEPGSYLDAPAEQGTIATVLGAGRRVAFVGNVADGAARAGLRARTDPGGWRAAFFWHLLGNQEQVLVAGNEATCTGDQIGDGEAIAFDNNTNTYALARASQVVAVSRDSVTLRARFATQQRGAAVGDAYYVGHWLQVVDGPGVGQARRIRSVQRAADNGVVVLRVEPAFESQPAVGSSRVLIGRSLWQVLVVGNRVDHRAPPCRNAAAGRPRGGGIGIWAQSADTVVARNRQYATDGIIAQHTYLLDDEKLGTRAASFVQFALEIRDNLIDAERDWRSNCSRSGIQIWHSAAPTPGQVPPVVGYGALIANNEIRRADGLGAAAIGVPLGWHAGPPGATPVLMRALLVQGNVISGLAKTPTEGSCDEPGLERAAIGFAAAPTTSGITLRGNRCVDTPVGLRAGAARLAAICDAPATGDCACAPIQAGKTR